MIKTLSTMTVYQLKLECKKLKIRGYSKLRKKGIRELLENHYRKEEIKKYEKDESIFCYPEILREIYSYVDLDKVDEERRKLIKNIPEKNKKLKKYIEIYYTKKAREKRPYLLTVGYGSLWSLKDDILFNEYLTYSLEKLMKSKKEILYRWLKGLQYKVTRKLKKKELKKLVEQYYNEIYN